jgi:hypothetical protein
MIISKYWVLTRYLSHAIVLHERRATRPPKSLPRRSSQLSRSAPCTIRASIIGRRLRSSAKSRKHAPFFSTTYTLFSIHNVSQPFSFVTTAHSLQKTPGGAVSSTHKFSDTHSARVTPTESISFALFLCNPFRILLFRNRGVGVGYRFFWERQRLYIPRTSRDVAPDWRRSPAQRIFGVRWRWC